MNLVFDIGNSRIKVGVFDQSVMRESAEFSIDQLTELEQFSKNRSPERVLVSSVKTDLLTELINNLDDNAIYLNRSTPLPIAISYKTPETLGVDRIAAAVAANAEFPESNSLVIDFGTCITYELLNEKAEYLGGKICPGVQMRFKAMNTFTDKLPLIQWLEKKENFRYKDVGDSTDSAMVAGVIDGIAKEVEGTIKSYQSRFKNLNILFTGGDAKFFESLIKLKIFADQNLVLKGLNEILLFNK